MTTTSIHRIVRSVQRANSCSHVGQRDRPQRSRDSVTTRRCPIDSLTADDRHSVAFARMPTPPFQRLNTMLPTSGTWTTKSQSSRINQSYVKLGRLPIIQRSTKYDEKSQQQCDLKRRIKSQSQELNERKVRRCKSSFPDLVLVIVCGFRRAYSRRHYEAQLIGVTSQVCRLR